MKLPGDGEMVEGEGNNAPAERQSEGPRSEEGGAGPGLNGSGVNGSEAHPQDPDFSEYLWMEHEDEFDEQVLKELEDEEMINYYFELYEESVAEEEEGRRRGGNSNSRNHHPQQPSHSQGGPVPAGCAGRIPESSRIGGFPPNQTRGDVDDITRGLDRVNFGSRLNPDAAEFVPRGPSSSNPSDDNHRPPPDTQPC